MSAIVAEGVHKRYRQYRDESMLLRRLLRPRTSRQHTDINALSDVSFTVERGTTVGIIGRNGAGKTTLLKLLGGVTAPSSGRIRVEGRIAPLVGVGVGFNGELTGRENVVVNGRLLGMSPLEVREQFDAIVEFSEIEEFIDVPVKFYSSGMFLRLAFSVAININPDIILIDEILAVGDVGFQAKCFDRLRELQHGGATVVVVTHNLQFLQRLTPRTIVLERGSVAIDGPTEEAVHRYHEILQSEQERRALPSFLPEELGPPLREATAHLRTTLVDAAGQPRQQIRAREAATIRVEVDFDEPVEDPIVGIAIEAPRLGIISAFASQPGDHRLAYGPEAPLHAQLHFDPSGLMPGSYSYRVVVRRPQANETMGISQSMIFHVNSDQLGFGVVDLRPRIEVDGSPVRLSAPRLYQEESEAS